MKFATKEQQKEKEGIRDLFLDHKIPDFLKKINGTIDSVNNMHERKIVGLRTQTFPYRQKFFQRALDEALKSHNFVIALWEAVMSSGKSSIN